LVVVLALTGIAIGIPRGVWAGLTNSELGAVLGADLLLSVIWFGNGFTSVLFSQISMRTTLIIFIAAAVISTGAHLLTFFFVYSPISGQAWAPLAIGLLSNLATATGGGALGILLAVRRKRRSILAGN
jgi:hypothetical protein